MRDAKYDVIYADPPWQYNRDGGSSAGKTYKTMSISEICALPVKKVSDENCLLFLWTTNSFLHEAFHVIDAWGFQYKTCLTWKKKKQGLGYWLWGITEHLLFASKGKHKRIIPPIASTFLEASSGEHSKKPMQFYELIEKFPSRKRLEMFARTDSPLFPKRAGWDVWGNEIVSDIDLNSI